MAAGLAGVAELGWGSWALSVVSSGGPIRWPRGGGGPVRWPREGVGPIRWPRHADSSGGGFLSGCPIRRPRQGASHRGGSHQGSRQGGSCQVALSQGGFIRWVPPGCPVRQPVGGVLSGGPVRGSPVRGPHQGPYQGVPSGGPLRQWPSRLQPCCQSLDSVQGLTKARTVVLTPSCSLLLMSAPAVLWRLQMGKG